jgi:hypothetical protein
LVLHALLPQPTKMAEPNTIATQRSLITGFISIYLLPLISPVASLDALRRMPHIPLHLLRDYVPVWYTLAHRVP